MCRSAKAVFEDHLRKRLRGALEEDLARNYADDVVLLTGHGVYRGKDGLRRCAARLRKQLPCPRYRYRTKRVTGATAFLEWTARGAGARVEDGADSFLIRGGRIVAQTIHYTVRRNRGLPVPPDPGPPGPGARAPVFRLSGVFVWDSHPSRPRPQSSAAAKSFLIKTPSFREKRSGNGRRPAAEVGVRRHPADRFGPQLRREPAAGCRRPLVELLSQNVWNLPLSHRAAEGKEEASPWASRCPRGPDGRVGRHLP